MNTTTQPRLPELMSVLITVALADLEAAENTPTLKVDMNYWHSPQQGKAIELCYVCFAGSVMAQTLGVSDIENVNPDDFSRWNRSRLQALDCIRYGNLSDAFNEMFPLEDVPENFPKDRAVAEYGHYPDAFKRDMKQIIAELESAGF